MYYRFPRRIGTNDDFFFCKEILFSGILRYIRDIFQKNTQILMNSSIFNRTLLTGRD